MATLAGRALGFNISPAARRAGRLVRLGVAVALLLALAPSARAQLEAAHGDRDPGVLGAGQAQLAHCDEAVHASFTTTYTSHTPDGAGAYVIASVRLSGIAPECAGHVFTVGLVHGADDQLAEATATYHDDAGDGRLDLDFLSAAVAASEVERLTVAITGS
jgi:hypothetical protein